MGRIIFTLLVAILTHGMISIHSTRGAETNRPPSVALSYPLPWVLAGDSISIEVTTEDPDNNLESVKVFRGSGQLVSSSTNGNYRAQILVTSGTNLFYAVAAYRLGASSTSAVLQVYGNRAPQVQLAAMQREYPTVQPIVLRLIASDPDGTVETVSVYQNLTSTTIGADTTEPYEITFTPPDAGIYQLVAEVQDNLGARSYSGATEFRFGGGADNLGQHLIIQSGTNLTLSGSNIDATRQKGEPEHADGGGNKSVWWAWKAPAGGGGTVVIDTLGSDFDTVLAVYKIVQNTHLSFSNLELVAENDDDSENAPISRVKFFAQPNFTYYIAVDGRDGVAGNVRLRINNSGGGSELPDVLSNELLATAANANLNVNATGSNVGASKEAGEPDHAGNPGGASVWWRCHLQPGVVIQITTTNSTFDTLLAVYTTNTYNWSSRAPFFSELFVVAENDDALPNVRSSTVRFIPPKEATYWIAVDGYEGAEGNVQLKITSAPLPAPTNNAFASAITLLGSSALTNGHNNNTTGEPGEPRHAGKTATNSVWYRWTAPTNGLVSISTRTSDFDTVLAVYTGNSLTNLTEVASNDDDPANPPTSAVVFHATAGTEYRIAVAGYQNARGEFVLALNQTPTFQPRLITQWLQGKLWLEPEQTGTSAILESSTDLVTWRVVQTLQPGDPAIAITTDAGVEMLFFRIRQEAE